MKVKNYASLILTFGIIAWAVIYVNKHFDEVRNILSVSFEKLVILILLVLIEIIINGYSTKIILHLFRVNLDFHEWFGLSAITTMGNFLSPFRGGVGIRALYLKSKFNFPITSFLSTVVATYIISSLISALIGIISLFLLYFYYDIFSISIFLLFFVVSLISLFFLFLSHKLPRFRNRYLSRINAVTDGWQKISNNYPLLLKLILLYSLYSFESILLIYFSFQTLSIDINILESSIIASLNFLSTLIAITPGGLGLNEAVIVLSSQLFGVILSQGIIAAALWRSAMLLWVFTLGPIYSFVLIGQRMRH
jgi:uncharacterized membrane protein YbhN (UPF0104 family)